MSTSAYCPHGRDYRDTCLDCLRPIEPIPRELLSPPEVTTVDVPKKSCSRCGAVHPWGTHHTCQPRVEVVHG